MESRTLGAICMGPTGNVQGIHQFFNLCTGLHICCNHWTPLPMPSEVIDRVNAWGRCSKADCNLTFTRRNNTLFPNANPHDEAGVGNDNVDSAGVNNAPNDPPQEDKDPDDNSDRQPQ